MISLQSHFVSHINNGFLASFFKSVRLKKNCSPNHLKDLKDLHKQNVKPLGVKFLTNAQRTHLTVRWHRRHAWHSVAQLTGIETSMFNLWNYFEQNKKNNRDAGVVKCKWVPWSFYLTGTSTAKIERNLQAHGHKTIDLWYFIRQTFQFQFYSVLSRFSRFLNLPVHSVLKRSFSKISGSTQKLC